MFNAIKQEYWLLLAVLAALIALPMEHALLGHGQAIALAGALALIAAIVCASLRVAHHAEQLAERVGDPYVVVYNAGYVEVQAGYDWLRKGEEAARARTSTARTARWMGAPKSGDSSPCRPRSGFLDTRRQTRAGAARRRLPSRIRVVM